MNEFLRTFAPRLRLDSDVVIDLHLNFRTVRQSEATILLSTSQIQESIYFITEGVIRRYTIENHEESTNWFFSRGDFAMSEDSFLIDSKSDEFLETTSVVKFVAIQKNEYTRLKQTYSEFNDLFNGLYKAYHTRLRHHNHLLKFHGGAENYEWFMKNQTYIFQRTKQRHLASFLGLTETSLSRIRNKIAKH